LLCLLAASLYYGFQFLIPFNQKIPHVLFEQNLIEEYSNKAKRRNPNQRVLHQSLRAEYSEFVAMFHGFESAARHFIREIIGPFKFNNARCEALEYSEVSGFKSHGFAEINEAGCDSRDSALFRMAGRGAVQTDVARQVEAGFERRVDFGFDSNYRHEIILTVLKFPNPARVCCGRAIMARQKSRVKQVIQK